MLEYLYVSTMILTRLTCKKMSTSDFDGKNTCGSALPSQLEPDPPVEISWVPTEPTTARPGKLVLANEKPASAEGKNLKTLMIITFSPACSQGARSMVS